MNCPMCEHAIKMKHSALSKILSIATLKTLKDRIEKEALQQLQAQKLHHDRRVTDPNSLHFNRIDKFAMDYLSYFLCFKCEKPYFGGRLLSLSLY